MEDRSLYLIYEYFWVTGADDLVENYADLFTSVLRNHDIQEFDSKWDRVAEQMMINFRESGHPVFRATSPLSRGSLKSKGGGKLSFHFCADEDTAETVFRTIISVNQLSIYGVVAEMCEEF